MCFQSYLLGTFLYFLLLCSTLNCIRVTLAMVSNNGVKRGGCRCWEIKRFVERLQKSVVTHVEMKSREHGGVGKRFITRMTEVTTKENAATRRDLNANQWVFPHLLASNTLSSFPKETALQEDTQKPSVRKNEAKQRGKKKDLQEHSETQFASQY